MHGLSRSSTALITGDASAPDGRRAPRPPDALRSYHEIPLKECHAWTREGCKMCPDFAAEHADISTGGIGAFNDWTLTIVRTDAGRELMDAMIRDGWIETRPDDDDPGAIALMHKLAIKSRKRWPEFAVEAPRMIPAPAPKA